MKNQYSFGIFVAAIILEFITAIMAVGMTVIALINFTNDALYWNFTGRALVLLACSFVTIFVRVQAVTNTEEP